MQPILGEDSKAASEQVLIAAGNLNLVDGMRR